MGPEIAPTIDLNLPEKLQDPTYRQEFFWAEASAEIAGGLVRLRKRRGLNQSEVANLVGTKQPAISRAEQADYDNWNLGTIRGIADALGARVRVTIEPYEDVLHEYAEEPADTAGDTLDQSVFGIAPYAPQGAPVGFVAGTAMHGYSMLPAYQTVWGIYSGSPIPQPEVIALQEQIARQQAEIIMLQQLVVTSKASTNQMTKISGTQDDMVAALMKRFGNQQRYPTPSKLYITKNSMQGVAGQ